MNLLQPPPRGGLSRVFRVLSLLLLQHALAPGIPDAQARSRLPVMKNPASLPYLKVANLALPLRFNSPPPPPELISQLTASDSPNLVAETDAIAQTTASIATSGPAQAENASAPATTLATNISPSSPTNPAVNVAKPDSPTPAPVSILPDDTRPSTKAEDFLPFFQFPANGGDMTILVPASATRAPAAAQQPLSSATYQQR